MGGLNEMHHHYKNIEKSVEIGNISPGDGSNILSSNETRRLNESMVHLILFNVDNFSFRKVSSKSVIENVIQFEALQKIGS